MLGIGADTHAGTFPRMILIGILITRGNSVSVDDEVWSNKEC
jgi:hypothetical protein